MKSNKILLLFLFVLFFAGTLLSKPGYMNFKWGMSPDEVKANMPSASWSVMGQGVIDKEKKFSSMAAVSVVREYTIRYTYLYLFYFEKNKLIGIYINVGNNNEPKMQLRFYSFTYGKYHHFEEKKDKKKVNDYFIFPLKETTAYVRADLKKRIFATFIKNDPSLLNYKNNVIAPLIVRDFLDEIKKKKNKSKK